MCSSYGPYDVFLRCGPSVALMVLMMLFLSCGPSVALMVLMMVFLRCGPFVVLMVLMFYFKVQTKCSSCGP
jgi:hypothetical protein